MVPPNLESIVAAVIFTGLRVGGIMVFAPFTGSDSITAPMKAVLTLLVTALIYPNTQLAGITASPLGWIRVTAGEVAIGLGLGLLLQFAFEAVQFAGQIFGLQTGYSLITLLDPQTEADSPSLIVFTRLMALLVFLEANVHHAVLRGVSASFAYLPPGGLGDVGWFSRGILDSAGGLWLAGLQMAAPVLAVTLVTDVALGFVGKVAPQLPATLAGIPVKNVLGLTAMGVAAGAWPRFLEREFTGAIAHTEKVLHLAR